MICAIVAMVIGSGSPTLQVEPQDKTQVFTLQNLRPSKFVKLVGGQSLPAESKGKSLKPAPPFPGVRSLIADDYTQRITAIGTSEGIHYLTNLIPLLDIVPRKVDVEVTVAKVHVKPDGVTSEETPFASHATTINNEPIDVP